MWVSRSLTKSALDERGIVYRSGDNGNSWPVVLELSVGEYPKRITANQANGITILTSNNEIFKSRDGVHWKIFENLTGSSSGTVLNHPEPHRIAFGREKFIVMIGCDAWPKIVMPSEIIGTVDEEVEIDASGSYDADGDNIEFRWFFADGPDSVELSDNISKPKFVPKQVGDYEFELMLIEDYESDISPLEGDVNQRVTVHVLPEASNQPPYGSLENDKECYMNEECSIQANFTDPENQTLFYNWNQIDDLELEWIDMDGEEAIIKPLGPGMTVIEVVVADDGDQPVTDSININVPNRLPVADAGETQTVGLGEELTLDGSGSRDPDQHELTYAWTQISGPSVSTTDADFVTVSFTPQVTGVYMFKLEVTDPHGGEDNDEVVIVVSEESIEEQCGNGVCQPDIGETTLTCSVDCYCGNQECEAGENPTNCPEDCQQAACPNGECEEGENTQNCPWDCDWCGNDFCGPEETENCLADCPTGPPAPGENRPPVVLASGDTGVKVGDKVVLKAIVHEPEGENVSYSWMQIGGSLVEILDGDTPNPSFTPTEAGVYSFQVTVVDENSNQANATVRVIINPGTGLPVDANKSLIVAETGELPIPPELLAAALAVLIVGAILWNKVSSNKGGEVKIEDFEGQKKLIKKAMKIAERDFFKRKIDEPTYRKILSDLEVRKRKLEVEEQVLGIKPKARKKKW